MIAPPYWPYREHRNMAQVMADEDAKREKDRALYNRDRKSWRRS